MASVFLHCHRRIKNGKEHRYWSITEKVRVRRGQWAQRHLLYLGEINDSQKEQWTKVIAVFDTQKEETAELALYPAGEVVPEHATPYGVQVRLQEFALHRPRQWGACWIGCQMWEQLELDKFWVMAGNTSDKTTLRDFLKKIEDLHGKAQRIWVMDRGIPTEVVLAEMRASDPPISYLVGTPKGRLKKYEAKLVEQPWKEVREGVEVKLLAESGELYVLAQSRDRVCKERAMRRRQLKKLWERLKELAGKELKRDELLLKLGAAKNRYPSAWRLVKTEIPEGKRKEVVKDWSYTLLKDKLRQIRRREGRYLLRTNLTDEDPSKLWKFYIQLTEVEAAFKNLKDDLSLRPIFHQLEQRIEAHVLVAFQAYCLQVSLRQRLRAAAPGLTPRSVLEKFSAIQMLDVHFPTTDNRTLIFQRYTQPEKDHKMILAQLQWELPPQSPRQITGQGKMEMN